MKTKTIALLGATGSVGRQTLEVVQSLGDHFDFSLLSAHQDYENLRLLASSWPRAQLALTDPCNENTSSGSLIQGYQPIIDNILASPPDILVIASSGLTAYPVLRDTFHVCSRVAVANKEILIMAGCTGLLDQIKKATCLMPVDSEHASIHQLLDGKNINELKQVFLTASGGPFYSVHPLQTNLERVSPEQALKHPTWKMGPKVSLDSATMANKGIEIMEAHYLFDLPPEKIKIRIHPLSLIHAMAEWMDHTSTLHVAPADMRICIQYALTWPQRHSSRIADTLDWEQISSLPFISFDPHSLEVIQASYLALDKADQCPWLPLAYLAADEIALELFLNNNLSFDQIGHWIFQKIIKIQDVEYLKKLPMNPYTIMGIYKEIVNWIRKGI